MAVVGHASSHMPQNTQRLKLMRKNSGYQRPSSRSAFCRLIQPTGQATAHKLHATQRSSPSGSRVSTMRPRKRGGTGTGCSGYKIVPLGLRAWLLTIHMERTMVNMPTAVFLKLQTFNSPSKSQKQSPKGLAVLWASTLSSQNSSPDRIWDA